MMGALTSKPKEQVATPPARPCLLKRIEDPRSPTEEISRTPIEVTEKFLKDIDANNLHRASLLKEQNQYTPLDSSPRLRKSELSKDFKKLKSTLASAFDNDATKELDNSTLMDKEVSEKENNYY